MKILYLVLQFYPAWFAGTEKFVLQLAQSCQRSGHQVKVITYDAQPTTTLASHTNNPSVTLRSAKGIKGKIADGLQKMGVDVRRLYRLYAAITPNPLLVREYCYENIPVLAFKYTRATGDQSVRLQNAELTRFGKQLFAQERPDLIHIAHSMRMVPLIQAAYEMQIPYLFTLTDYWLICPRNILLTEAGRCCAGGRGGLECRRACSRLDAQHFQQRRKTMQPLLKDSQRIIAPSRFLAEKVATELGLSEITVIPYGTALQHLPQNQRRYPHDRAITFLFAARLVKEKGVALLLQAFRQLPHPQVRLCIYGAGPLVNMVQEAAKQDARIYYGGIYSNQALGNLLTQVDVAVVPSLWHENMPLLMQEAQACGVPTLVSDVGGMTECVTDGVNGFTFRVGDVADLQRKMQMIINQPEILNAIKENICNPKPGQYRVTSLEEEATMYLEQYERILEKQSQATVCDSPIS
ncbi:MAG: glycosyltransferase [Caldilineaceae bacterium]